MAFNSMRSHASENGFMTNDEIEAEIVAARKISHSFGNKNRFQR